MRKIILESGNFGWDYILRLKGTNKTLLIQTDWDYPGTASSFGWSPCDCGSTDGTVDCAHKTASQMIAEAGEYLDSIADTDTDAEDPGYFSESA
jgi:hypothetical protein